MTAPDKPDGPANDEYLPSTGGGVYKQLFFCGNPVFSAKDINDAIKEKFVPRWEYDELLAAKRNNDDFLLKLNLDLTRLKELAGKMAEAIRDVQKHPGNRGMKQAVAKTALSLALSAYEAWKMGEK